MRALVVDNFSCNVHLYTYPLPNEMSMKDISQIPYLIQLIDVESAQVRDSVLEELLSFCPILDEAISVLGLELTPTQSYAIHQVNRTYDQLRIEEKWRGVMKIKDPWFKLEGGLDFLGQIQSHDYPYRPASWVLDRLSIEFRRYHRRRDPAELAHFLFKMKRLRAHADDDSDPLHHNLAFILHEGIGAPIVLTCVYILVGWRLGLRIQGCNLPGRFLARTHYDGRDILVDCYRGGKILDHHEVAALCLAPSIQLESSMRRPPTPDQVLSRILRSLAKSYLHLGKTDQTQIVERLTQSLAATRPEDKRSQAQFEPGQLIQHKRYGYRGVVVDYDLNCRADDTWYQGNRTQPARDQPWYHVLVHGTDYSTYTAESNLKPDQLSKKVYHPLIPVYFDQFENGSYVRNTRPWLPRHG